MGIVSRLLALGERRDLTERDWLRGTALWAQDTASGRAVTPAESMQLVAVYACVRVLAETIGTLPLFVYRRLEPRGRERDNRHPLYSILHERPNPLMTGVEFRECMMGHAALRGNAYAEIVPLAGGGVELWPLRPDRMRVVQLSDREIGYLYRLPSGEERALPRSRVHHWRGLSSDGLIGYSPVALAREAIGLGLALEEFAARLFGNNARPGGVLQTKDRLSDEGAKRLKASWEEAHRGLEASHRVAILEEGVTWQSVSMNADDAQFLESRKMQTTEIARIFRIPPHLIQDLERATFTNIEHQGLEFVTHTLRPWLVRIEQAIKRDLLAEDSHYAEFLVDGLLRGDIQSRYAAYSVAKQNGWLSANDIRETENLNPISADDGGDTYMVQLNMTPAGMLGQDMQHQEPQSDPQADDPQRALRSAETRAAGSASNRLRLTARYRRLFVEATGRLVRREIADVRSALEHHLTRRDAQSFIAWARDYYRDFGPIAARTLGPVMAMFADVILEDAAAEIGSDDPQGTELQAFVAEIARAFGEHYAGQSLGQIQQQLRLAEEEGADPSEVIEERLQEWSEKRADKVADIEPVRLGNAVTRERWKRGGVRRIVWIRQGSDSCPFCRKLDGKTVGIEQTFAGDGDEIEGNETSGSLRVDRPTRHPPIHAACHCGLRPDRG